MRLPKIVRITRIFKLFRMLSVYRQMAKQKNMSNSFSQDMQINQGRERLSMIMGTLFFVVHLLSCFWIVLARFVTDRNVWLSNDIAEKSGFDIYCTAFYFIVTTMTTVGFGDISANNLPEQVFCTILMLIGVTFFAVVSGSLAAMLNSVDSVNAKMEERLIFLNKLSV